MNPHQSIDQSSQGKGDLHDAELYKLLVSNVTDNAIFALDPNGNVSTWNLGARNILGYEPEEIVGKHFSQFFVESDITEGKPAYELVEARTKGKFEGESWRIRKDGTLFWAAVAVTPILDEHQDLIGYAKVTRDLTERKMAEEKLKRSEETFRLMVSAVQDYAIFMLDPNGYVMTWNEGAQRLKGYSESEIIGSHFSRFYTQDAIDINHPANELELAKRDGHYQEEGWRIRKDGTLFWASVTITAVWDANRELRGFVKVTRDLTERKIAEEELAAARDAAIEANKLKSQFVANISHEVRTPMGGVIGMAELLLLKPLAKEDLEIAQHIFSASQRLLEVLNDLLDFSKLEAGAVEIERVRFNVKSLVQEAVATIKTIADKKGITLEVCIGEDLPEYVTADEAKIHQSLLNLVHNAIKFTQAGHVRVAVSLDPAHSDRILFSVEDTGIGIDSDTMKRLFEPFVQADGSHRRRFGGTGLGLSITKRFIELIGGSVGVRRNDDDDGSTFWFSVPVEQS